MTEKRARRASEYAVYAVCMQCVCNDIQCYIMLYFQRSYVKMLFRRFFIRSSPSATPRPPPLRGLEQPPVAVISSVSYNDSLYGLYNCSISHEMFHSYKYVFHLCKLMFHLCKLFQKCPILFFNFYAARKINEISLSLHRRVTSLFVKFFKRKCKNGHS